MFSQTTLYKPVLAKMTRPFIGFLGRLVLLQRVPTKLCWRESQHATFVGWMGAPILNQSHYARQLWGGLGAPHPTLIP